MQNLNTEKNILGKLENFIQMIHTRIQKITRKRVKEKKRKTFEDINHEKKTKQDKTDRILDKISKSGYDSLTKEERDFLFNQSKNA